MQQSKPQIANTIDVLYLNKGSKMQIKDVFPTPIGMFNYGNLSDKELEAINSLEMVHNQNNNTSLNQSVLDTPALSGIKDFIEAALKTYLAETLSPSPNMTHYITQSWANLSEAEDYHHFHTHTNSIASGVFYVAVDKEKDSITFSRQAKDIPFVHQVLFPDIERPTDYNTEEWDIPIDTGNLFMFPSTLVHGVKQINNRTSDRISISFNTYVKGQVAIAGVTRPNIYFGT